MRRRSRPGCAAARPAGVRFLSKVWRNSGLRADANDADIAARPPGTRPEGVTDENEAAARVREMFGRIAPRIRPSESSSSSMSIKCGGGAWRNSSAAF